jgi:hypothetical protein
MRLLSRASGALFPEDLRIEGSTDNVAFTTLTSVTGLPSDARVWHTLEFTRTDRRGLDLDCTW